MDIVREKYRHLIIIGCCAHWGNLTLGDIAKHPEVKPLIIEIKNVCKYFKKSSSALSILKKYQSALKTKGPHSPVLYGDTRWTSMLGMIEFLLANEECLKSCLGSSWIDEYMPEETKNIIHDKTFWKKARAFKIIVEAITKFVNMAQSDSPNLPKIYKEWLELQKHLQDSFPQQSDNFLHKLIEERSAHFKSAVFLFAYHVDPANITKKLTKEDSNTISTWLKTFLPTNEVAQVISELILLKYKQNHYADDVIWSCAEILEPLLWWNQMAPESKLKYLALRVLMIPASSAASERAWSVFGLILTKLRNRLDPKKLNKIAFIAWNYPKLKGTTISPNELFDHLVNFVSDDHPTSDENNDRSNPLQDLANELKDKIRPLCKFEKYEEEEEHEEGNEEDNGEENGDYDDEFPTSQDEPLSQTSPNNEDFVQTVTSAKTKSTPKTIPSAPTPTFQLSSPQMETLVAKPKRTPVPIPADVSGRSLNAVFNSIGLKEKFKKKPDVKSTKK